MNNLLICTDLNKSFGVQRLFSSISFSVQHGDRIGIIGPNGSGKSTLLKIICDLEEMDSGEVHLARFAKRGYLAQHDSLDDRASIIDNLYQCIEAGDDEQHIRINALLGRAKFPDTSVAAGQLSGGWRKRLAICRAMLTGSDLLVLDEPTNHLDIEGIIWLEKMINSMKRDSAVLMVSHDRRFLENCTNKIIELSRVYPEGSLQAKGSYSTFLEIRQKFLYGQHENEGRLANKFKRELEWLRRGPKARATKAKYRIEEAYKLQDELTEVKARNRSLDQVQIAFTATGRKTKKLMEMKGISKGYDGKMLFTELDITLVPGSRLGLLGRNGCGKSTLMKILAGGEDCGEVKADSGIIHTANNVQIVHFDQQRLGLDPEITLRRALAPEGDSIIFRDRSLHVVSWAKRFLFSPEQLETPVGQLSGGERARIFIADIIRQPADILLLDEPTNDLDIASLDVLEASLMEFPGALVLVSHDRFLLDRVCDQVLGFNGKGEVQFFADYEQWLGEMQQDEKEEQGKNERHAHAKKEKKERSATHNKKKLSYLEQREYDQIEDRINQAEEHISKLEAQMASDEFGADADGLAVYWEELDMFKNKVEQLYTRWEELEEKKNT